MTHPPDRPLPVERPREIPPELPSGPHKTMHDDDPVITRKWPTKFNRKNVKIVASIGGLLTFIFLCIFGGQLLAQGNDNDAQIARTNAVARTANSVAVANKKLVQQIIDERTERRKQVNSSIRELACTIIAEIPDSSKQPQIHAFRVKYHCPPYKKPVVNQKATPGSASTPGANGAAPTPAPGGDTDRTRTSTTVIAGRTIVKTEPKSTVTKSITKTKPAPTPAPVPSPTHVICILNICVL